MQFSKNFSIKERITHAIFTGAAVMLVAFLIALFFPKEWLVSGKIVIFPSGKPVSASENLLPEVGNTAWIINSDAFQERNFAEVSADFEGAAVVKNSSMVLVKFRSREEDIAFFEDAITKIPSQVDEYARDLYEGSPFKYKLAADPEISARPVRPNIAGNAYLGFAAGVLIYLVYWFFFESGRPEEKLISPAEPEKSEAKKSSDIKSPDMSVSEPTPEVNKKKMITPRSEAFAAPENLPFVDESAPTSEITEPSDEEVKERLNRLMRGEL